MLSPLILVLVRKKNVKYFYNNLGCPIHNNKNYMVPSIIIQIVKICPGHLYNTSVEGIL